MSEPTNLLRQIKQLRRWVGRQAVASVYRAMPNQSFVYSQIGSRLDAILASVDSEALREVVSDE